MPLDRLSPLDSSFLEVETPSAHMHVGWAAIFDPPRSREPPTFEAIREHIASRLGRAPRYRQKLAFCPFEVDTPVWVDDAGFDIGEHVWCAPTSGVVSRAQFREIVSEAASDPLDHRKPLWSIGIVKPLAGGRIGAVGKVHHCMVDGLAAVELGALLMDTEPDPPPTDPDNWRPAAEPTELELLATGAWHRVREPWQLMREITETVTSPSRMVKAAERAVRATEATARDLLPIAPASPLNPPIGPARQMGFVGRRLEDLKQIKRTFGTTLNDVMLAVAAGGTRRWLRRWGLRPQNVKAMVPVSIRTEDERFDFGNRLSFIFVELPVEEPDPVRRLLDVTSVTCERKSHHDPEATESLLRAATYTPHAFHRLVARLVASPRVFNLVVSNIPGPQVPLYMMGARLREAYPIVPLADRHALSIGVTTVAGGAYFGLYADRDGIPDLDALTRGIGASVDELLARC